MKRFSGHLPALAVAVLLSIFFLREMFYISYVSPTFDEGQYTSYGFSLLKTGDYRLANFKPNLVPLLSSLPVAAAGARLDTANEHWRNLDKRISIDDVWPFTLHFLHRNVLAPDTLLFYARLPIIFMALLLGLGVYHWASRLYGWPAGLLSLFLFTTCPNMLAHGGLVTEDMAFAFLSFASVYLFYLYNRSERAALLAAAAAALGLALNAKYTAVLLFPALAAYCLLEHRASGESASALRRRGALLAAAFAAAAAAVFLFYGFPAIKYYLTGLYRTAVHIDGGQMAFLNGRYSITGFWNYFICALLYKTTLPALIFAGLAAVAGFRDGKLFDRDAVYLTLFPALLLLAASVSNFQIGLRHVLPVYPFLFVYCGGAVKLFKGRMGALAPAALLLWQGWTSASVHPYYLTYFNELAGGTARGHERLLDSNIDWGQDLKELRRYLRAENVSDLVLSYYGSTVPEYLGRPYQDLLSSIAEKDGHANSLAPAREYLAVSATNLHGLYFQELGKDVFYWLRGRPPKAVIGNNIRVYDITSDAAAHEHLANTYFMAGYPEQAERECLRALVLSPGSKRARFLLALVRIKEKRSERDGLARLKAYLRETGFSAPEALVEFMPSQLFRYRYYRISLYAADKFGASSDAREADFLRRLAESIEKGGNPSPPVL